MPVYVDVLLIVNGFVNYLMLVCSMKYLKINGKRFRLLLASAVGSVFSLKIFLPDIPMIPELTLRCVVCSLIIFAAFGKCGIRTFFRNVCVFFTVNLLFGGLMSAVFFFTDTNVMLYKNGTVYFDIDLKILAVTSVASFAVINAISMFIARKAAPESIFYVTAELDGKTVCGRGFADTGNNLHDVFSGFPVIVAEYEAVKSILPEEVEKYCLEGDFLSVTGKIRLVPVSSVGSDALLPAFRPHSVTLKSIHGERQFKDVYIAVSRQKFFGGEYEFILNNDLSEVIFNEHNKKADIKAEKKKQDILHKRA